MGEFWCGLSKAHFGQSLLWCGQPNHGLVPRAGFPSWLWASWKWNDTIQLKARPNNVRRQNSLVLHRFINCYRLDRENTPELFSRCGNSEQGFIEKPPKDIKESLCLSAIPKAWEFPDLGNVTFDRLFFIDFLDNLGGLQHLAR
jgi:hypothetical protein